MAVKGLDLERDRLQASLEELRRRAPILAQSMMIFYDALIEAGFDDRAALMLVADKFLQD